MEIEMDRKTKNEKLLIEFLDQVIILNKFTLA